MMGIGRTTIRRYASIRRYPMVGTSAMPKRNQARDS